MGAGPSPNPTIKVVVGRWVGGGRGKWFLCICFGPNPSATSLAGYLTGQQARGQLNKCMGTPFFFVLVVIAGREGQVRREEEEVGRSNSGGGGQNSIKYLSYLWNLCLPRFPPAILAYITSHHTTPPHLGRLSTTYI